MSIHEMYFDEYTSIGDTDSLRRKDHVIVAGNVEGVYPNEQVGFTHLHEDIIPVWTTFEATAKGKVGDVVSWYDEASYVWYHAVIAYSVADGWDADDTGTSNYHLIKAALDSIWEEHEDDYVRPFRITWFGRGKARQHGRVNGNITQTIAALADTECRLAVYTRVPVS